MGEEQRGCVIQLWKEVNQQWEEPMKEASRMNSSYGWMMGAV